MVFDPYLAVALALFWSVVVLIELVSARWSASARAAGFEPGLDWWRTRRVLERARALGPAVAAPLPGAPWGGFAVVVAAGGRAALLPARPDLRPITRAAVALHADGQSRLWLEVEGQAVAVQGFGPMLRVWSLLQRDGVPVPVIVQQGARDVMGELDEVDRGAVQRWLVPGESVVFATDQVVGTDRRLGLLAGRPTERRCADWIGPGVRAVTCAPRPRQSSLLFAELVGDCWLSPAPTPSSAGKRLAAGSDPRVVLSLTGAGLPIEFVGERWRFRPAEFVVMAGACIFFGGKFVGVPAALVGNLVLGGALWLILGQSLDYTALKFMPILFVAGTITPLLILMARGVGERVSWSMFTRPHGVEAGQPLTTARTKSEGCDRTRDEARPSGRIGAAAVVLGAATAWAFLHTARAHLGWTPLGAHSREWFDPYLVVAAAVFLLTVAGVGAFTARVRWRAQRSAWARVRVALARARATGPAVVLPLAGGRSGEAVVIARGARACVLPGTGDLTSVEGATILVEAGGRASLFVRVGGRIARVTGVADLARAWSQLQPDQVPIALELQGTDEEYDRRKGQQAAAGCLHPGENVVACFLAGVDLPGAGSEYNHVVITHDRVGQLRRAGVTFLPMPECVRLQPKREGAWQLDLMPTPGQARASIEVEEHKGAVLVPFMTNRLPVSVPGRVARGKGALVETAAPSLILGLLGGILCAPVSVLFGEALGLGGLMLPFGFVAVLLPCALLAFTILEQHLEWNGLASLDDPADQRSS